MREGVVVLLVRLLLGGDNFAAIENPIFSFEYLAHYLSV